MKSGGSFLADIGLISNTSIRSGQSCFNLPSFYHLYLSFWKVLLVKQQWLFNVHKKNKKKKRMKPSHHPRQNVNLRPCWTSHVWKKIKVLDILRVERGKCNLLSSRFWANPALFRRVWVSQGLFMHGGTMKGSIERCSSRNDPGQQGWAQSKTETETENSGC